MRALRFAGLCVLALVGCSRLPGFGSKTETTAPARKAPARSAPAHANVATGPLAEKNGDGTARKGGAAAVESAPVPAWEAPPAHARGSLFSRLPKGTLLALRLPEVARLSEAYRRTPLSGLLGSPLFAGAIAQFEKGLDQARADLLPRLKDVDALLAGMRALTGEVVIAIPSVDLGALTSGAAHGAPPFTIAVLYQAGTSADTFQKIIDTLVDVTRAKDGSGGLDVELPLVAPGDRAWLRRRRDDSVCVTLARDGDLFSLTVTTASVVLATDRAFAPLELEDSFNAAELVRATADTGASGGQPVAEFFLNLQPVWGAVALALPPEAKDALTASGATSIGGVSMTASLGPKGMNESALFFSPGSKDLLSRFCSSRPLGWALARWIPADFSEASLCSLDFNELFDGIRALLPPEARQQFDTSMAQLRTQTGIDLRADVFRNFGPTFAFAANGDPAKGVASLDWVCAIELQDGTRARRVLDRFLLQSGLAAAVHPSTVESLPVSSLELPPAVTPTGGTIDITPTWRVDDHALVIASKSSALRQAILAAKANQPPKSLRVALDAGGDATFAVATHTSAGATVATIGRRTPAGLELDTVDGQGTMMSGAAVFGTAIAASVALPRLVQSRASASERVAIQTLQQLYQAELKARETQVLDLDGDGHGEFCTLAELSGQVPVRGRAAPSAFLGAGFAPDANGVLQRGGYCFRIDLPTRLGSGVAVLPPGQASPVSNDLAEQNFTAYAWPAEPGTTMRVFFIDATGGVFFSKNDGPSQHYGGTRAPRCDAALLRDPSDKVKGVTAVRRGRDNGIWFDTR